MNTNDPSYPDAIGYIQYHGKLAEDGYMDARELARVLNGLDQSIKHFARSRHGDDQIDFPLPVKVQKGSVVAVIPDISMLATTGLAAVGGAALIFGGAYLKKAAEKLAENDIEKKTTGEVIKKSIQSVMNAVAVAKHMGVIAKHKFTNIQWRNNNEEIGITNDKGELAYFPAMAPDDYDACPKDLLEDLASAVQVERELKIVLVSRGGVKSVSIGYQQKSIFCSETPEEDVLFPELEEGSSVQLEGEVTRGNNSSNTIGFRYKGHILTCRPSVGNVAAHKPAMFLMCRMCGTVHRVRKPNEEGKVNDRPEIFFTALVPIGGGSLPTQRQLFP